MDLLINMESCIFCYSSNLKRIQKISKEEIQYLYLKKLHIDISSELLKINEIVFFECLNCHLSFFYPCVIGSEKFYENLQAQESNYYQNNRPEFDLALKHIEKNNSVLEIGAGSALFASKLKTNSYTGLEYNDQAIKEARNLGINLIKSSIEEFTSNTDKKYDIVCSFHVLEHVKNPLEFIESSLEVLKSGGKLIFAVPCYNSYLTKNVNHVLNMPPHHITRWSLEAFKYIGETYKLKLLEIQVDDVKNRSNYFEFKYAFLLNKLLFPRKTVLNISSKYDLIFKVIKKINKKLNLYKLESRKPFFGKNIVVIYENT